MENNISIMTVNYNTPEFIFTLISSFKKYNKWCKTLKIDVIDNGVNKELPEGSFDNFTVKYFDKKLYSFLEKYKYKSKDKTLASAHHSYTIDWYIKNVCKTDYLLILDSDIIFTRSFETELNDFIKNNYFLMGFERTNYKCHCIAPWACFLNIKKMKEQKLSYFDINRILYVNGNVTHDTGASLYEDAIKLNNKIKKTKDNTFYLHLKGGSLDRSKRMKFILKYKKIWDD